MHEEMRTFGYLCPQCGKMVMASRSVFALAASNAEVECECGGSVLRTEFDGQKYHVYVPCGICGETHVAVCRQGSKAVVTIRDYGPGVPEEELPHVKYKFYKGSSKARGSGIGLAVCDEIIARHNGTLEIGNAEGGGCIVTIRLPMDMAENGT